MCELKVNNINALNNTKGISHLWKITYISPPGTAMYFEIDSF